MFCHFIIHSQFEHDLSHARANGSPSEEPDSALSDDPTVHRNGPVWSGHDSGSRACSGGVGSCSYWHRRWIWRTQTPFPWALLILFDRYQRRDRDYATHENSPNPLRCPGGNRFTNPVLVWAELIWLGSGRVHNYTVLLAPVQSLRSYRARTETENWNQRNGPVSRRSLPINAPPLSLVLSCTVWSRADCTGASKIVLFVFATGVSTRNLKSHQNTL